jgi:hypothetical protein
MLNTSEPQIARTEKKPPALFLKKKGPERKRPGVKLSGFWCRRADGSNGVKSKKTLSGRHPGMPTTTAEHDRRHGSIYPNLYTKT